MTHEKQGKEIEGLEELVSYFAVKARENDLEIDSSSDWNSMDFPDEERGGYSWPQLRVSSEWSNLHLEVNPCYALGIGREESIRRYNNSQFHRVVAGLLAKGEIGDAEKTLRKIVRTSISPIVVFEDVEIALSTSLVKEGAWLENDLFRVTLDLDKKPYEISTSPNVKDYSEKDAFERATRIWTISQLPVIQKYGGRLQEITLLDNLPDLGRKVIDLGIEICKDEELDKLLEENSRQV